MAAQIFGIDHGNGAVKGGNVNIPCGLVSYVSEPGRFMNEDILEYDGRYFTLSDKRMPFKEDKIKSMIIQNYKRISWLPYISCVRSMRRRHSSLG